MQDTTRNIVTNSIPPLHPFHPVTRSKPLPASFRIGSISTESFVRSILIIHSFLLFFFILYYSYSSNNPDFVYESEIPKLHHCSSMYY